MVQRASSETPSLSGNNRESSRMGLGIGYTAYQSGYNKLFTQVYNNTPLSLSYLLSIYSYFEVKRRSINKSIRRESVRRSNGLEIRNRKHIIIICNVQPNMRTNGEWKISCEQHKKCIHTEQIVTY